MTKAKGFSVLIILTLCFSLILAGTVEGQIDLSSDLDDTFLEISNEEKAILDELFILSQEIDEINESARIILEELDKVQGEISKLEASIKSRQENYDSQLKILEAVLVAYQKNGPATFLEILLSADSLRDFIKRLNLVKDLSKNTEKLLSTLEEEKGLLALEQEALKAIGASLEEKDNELQAVLSEKLQRKQNQEAILTSLSEKKDQFEEQLRILEQSWSPVRLLLADISTELTRIIYESDLSVKDFNLSFGLLSVKGSISDNIINETVKNDPETPELIFTFTPEGIQLYIPEYELLLNGSVSIDDKSGCAFRYIAEEGTFHGFPLEKYAIQDLFRDGYILIDFSKIVGDNITIKSVKLKDSIIEFTANPFF